MPKQPIGWKYASYIAIWAVSILLVHYGIERSDVWLIPLFGASFLAYLFVCLKVELDFKQILALAVLIRLALFFGEPTLSDDYFRFLWDGRIWLEGFNPYEYTPNELLNQLPNDFSSLYAQLNSQPYHSTYPPFSQYIFSIPVWLGVSDMFWSMTVLRTVLLLFEMGLLFFLFDLTRSVKKLALFALNPLVVVELTGNLHFEGVVLFFILLAWWLYERHNWIGGATALVFGVLTKLTPLMFLPVLVRKIGLKRSTRSYLLIGFLIILLSFPFLELELINGMGNGLDLFFRKFEFNAGLFFLVREIGFLIYGYDVVQSAGPWMSMIALVAIVCFALLRVNQETEWADAFMIILFLQLMFSTTVHPWYVIPLLAFGCFAGYGFPIVWSGLVILSYLGYTVDGYEHPMLWIAVEYLVVFSLAAYELFFNKPLLKNV